MKPVDNYNAAKFLTGKFPHPYTIENGRASLESAAEDASANNVAVKGKTAIQSVEEISSDRENLTDSLFQNRNFLKPFRVIWCKFATGLSNMNQCSWDREGSLLNRLFNPLTQSKDEDYNSNG